MPFQISSTRGLIFNQDQIAEAELFCNLSAGDNEQDIKEQREIAAQLAFYFETEKKDKEKAFFYLTKAIAASNQEGFEYTIYDVFTGYTIPRIFIGAINRLTSIFKVVFLPLWFPLMGLSYLIQGPVAYAQGDTEKGHYYSLWGVFNAVGSVGLVAALLGVSLGPAGPAILLTGTLVGLYGIMFDVQFNMYKYFTATKTHDSLLAILENPNLTSRPHVVAEVKKEIEKTRSEYKEAILGSSVMFIGISIYVLSGLIPPVFIGLNIIGAAIALTAASALMGRFIYNSWTDKLGFLKVFVRDPMRKWLKLDGPSAPSPAPHSVPPVNSVFLTKIKDIISTSHSFSETLSKLDANDINIIKNIFNFGNRDSAWKKQLKLWLEFNNEKGEQGIKKGFYYCSFRHAIEPAIEAIHIPNQENMMNLAEQFPRQNPDEPVVSDVNTQRGGLRFFDAASQDPRVLNSNGSPVVSYNNDPVRNANP